MQVAKAAGNKTHTLDFSAVWAAVDNKTHMAECLAVWAVWAVWAVVKADKYVEVARAEDTKAAASRMKTMTTSFRAVTVRPSDGHGSRRRR